MPDPRDRPALQLGPLLAAIASFQIDWVLSGSLVLVAHGAAISPNDLDLVPSPEPQNLTRVAELLRALEAVPAFHPTSGGALSLEECLAWTPEPSLEHLDHLFVTTLGMLDVPPRLTGTYVELTRTSTAVTLAGRQVLACNPREVLGRLPSRPRAKDLERAAEYEKLRRRLP